MRSTIFRNDGATIKRDRTQSPGIDRFRWPAEWEPHCATWVAWPVNPNTWPGIFERIPGAFANFVATLACFEPVCILADTKTIKPAQPLVQEACRKSAATHSVTFFDIAVNDSWCRDYGPIFLNRRSDVKDKMCPAQVIVNWDYNAWGGKYPPWNRDADAAKQIAHQLQVRALKPGVVLEGGAIEGNGHGMILTTENCLLKTNRNARASRVMMEAALRTYMNAEHIVWIPGEGIVGDDTDGHIDQLARFCGRDSILVAAPFDDDAPEAAALKTNRRALEDAVGCAFQLTDLHLPAPKFQQNSRLPASYCNFYLCNGAVLCPTFEDPADEAAMQTLQDVFPDRQVVGIPCIDLAWGLGALHCLTQPQPAA